MVQDYLNVSFDMYIDRNAMNQIHIAYLSESHPVDLWKRENVVVKMEVFNDPMGASNPSTPARPFSRGTSTALPSASQPPKFSERSHTKNHMDAPSNVAEYRYRGRAYQDQAFISTQASMQPLGRGDR